MDRAAYEVVVISAPEHLLQMEQRRLEALSDSNGVPFSRIAVLMLESPQTYDKAWYRRSLPRCKQ